MAAPSPRTSLARLEANRRNAQRSTGPKTEAGKARARANAVKHGLTGAGVALPVEDAAAVAETFRAVNAEMAPQSVIGAFLAQQMALAMVRCGRAALQEAATLAERVEEAPGAFDEAREARVDALYAAFRSNPAVIRRKLMATPEGIERLFANLFRLREGLVGAVIVWDHHRHDKLGTLLGYTDRDFVGTRGSSLSRAILGDVAGIDPAEVEHLEPAAVCEWACRALVDFLDDEILGLNDHHATLDHAGIARNRARAADRALTDASPEAARARKYEAAARRDFSQSLRDFHRAEALAAPELAPDSVESPAIPDPADRGVGDGPPSMEFADEAPTVGADPVAAPVDVARATETTPSPAANEPKSLSKNDLESPLGSFWKTPAGPVEPQPSPAGGAVQPPVPGQDTPAHDVAPPSGRPGGEPMKG